MRAPKLIVLGAMVATVLATASIATATFSSAVSGGSMSLGSATLAPPTAPAASQTNCKNNKPPQITVGWTGSSSGFTTGYTIKRATTSGGPYSTVGTVASGTTSFLDTDPTLASTTTYYYVVEATFQAWTAPSSQAAVTTLNHLCA